MKYFVFALAVTLLSAACTQVPIANFEECVEAGNPVMESYPRQCRANGVLFVEEVELPIEPEPSNGELEFTSCPEERLQICTREYRPVCGLTDNGIRCVTEPCASADAITYSTGCTACAEEAVHGYYEGACENIQFVVCKETVTGFSAEEYAANVGGVCVDICPNNFDAFVTQIGVEVCIQHYGVEEINEWSVCTKSSSSCDCVKAYETTSDEQIEDAEYRCVPEAYGDRLLFRGGKDYLDENGRQSVVIA